MEDKSWSNSGGNYIQRLKIQTRISPQSATIDFRWFGISQDWGWEWVVEGSFSTFGFSSHWNKALTSVSNGSKCLYLSSLVHLYEKDAIPHCLRERRVEWRLALLLVKRSWKAQLTFTSNNLYTFENVHFLRMNQHSIEYPCWDVLLVAFLEVMMEIRFNFRGKIIFF